MSMAEQRPSRCSPANGATEGETLGYELTYELTVPAAMSQLHLATVRVARRGGATEADHAFRAELFVRIGAVTAAGGHVEAAMKRLLLLLSGKETRFSLVDDSWSELHRKLKERSTGDGPKRMEIARVLEWGEANRVKERRDNVVHAYWWLYDGCGVRASRFYRKEDGAVLIGTWQELDTSAQLLFQYADLLDQLLDEDWSRALLPPKRQDSSG